MTFRNCIQDSLAITYHNTSPLENMHAAVLVRLLLQPSLNFLSHLPGEVFKTVRKLATEAILGTDPAAHRQYMDAWSRVRPKWQKSVACVQSTAGAGLDMRNEMGADEVSAALVMLLKCADLGHMSQPFEQHKVWVELLTEEFFQQGDREKALGMAPLPFMNRNKPQCIATSQVRARCVVWDGLLCLTCQRRAEVPELWCCAADVSVR